LQVSYNWLNEYVDISDYDPKDLAEALTMSGSNVEHIKYLGEKMDDRIVTGKIKTKKSHPNADKLWIYEVDIKTDVLQIVSGAENIEESNIVPVALPGCCLPNGQKITEAEFRGEKSQGMMCSPRELELDLKIVPENQQHGILILPDDTPIGESFKEVIGFDDYVFEFEITSNRPDCLSIIGIARETAATLGRKVKYPRVNLPEGKGNARDMVGVQIKDEQLCSRYTARIVDNVKIGPSPLWLQNKLRSAGIRPINNIVDITNLVMLETGQPLHAFDYSCLKGRQIIVRRAQKNEKITTLDGKERVLDEDILVIADSERPVGIAGVMGGLNSEITSETKTVLLESANFYHANIRETSKKLGLRTEASTRFEKGLDPELALEASNRFVQLVDELNAGEIVKGVIDVYPVKPKINKIKLRFKRANQLLGTDISPEEMIEMLERLEIKIVEKGDSYVIAEPPSFRNNDLTREVDLIEEIARLYGYDKIKPTLPTGETTAGKINYRDRIIDKTKYILNSCGLNEIITPSFTGPKAFENIKLKEDSYQGAVKIKNPLGEDQSLMRTTLIPHMLDVITYNLNKMIEKARFFEVGTIYIAEQLPLKDLPKEERILNIGMAGECDFYSLKGVVETLLESLRIREYKFSPFEHPSFHPGRTALLKIKGEIGGVMGEIHPDVMENYDIAERVYIGEFKLEKIIDYTDLKYKYEPLPRYPAVNRDIAILVKDEILADTVRDCIQQTAGEIIEEIKLFDVYKGKQIPEGYKSLAFSIKYRSHERTLTDEEVNQIHEKIIKTLENKLNAKLRM